MTTLLIQKEEGSEEKIVDPKGFPKDLYKWDEEEEEDQELWEMWELARHLQREEDQRMYEQMFGVDWRNNPDAQRYVREVEEQYRRAWSNMRPG